ncbi:protein toll-like [Vanessa atalanta]|uniref:protein toll-like n=1 Tax=Vanessa atalanta TaxID=42275 RepID=UPI001FCCCDB0|nr:protein toll-like [Vanessa atalanta]
MPLNRIWICVWTCLVLAAAEGPRCPPWATQDQCQENGSVVDEHFFVVNGQKLQITSDVRYFHLTCPENVSLESEVLPRFERAVKVLYVKLTACAPPSQGYAAALQALNISVRSTLELDKTPAQPELRAVHLRDLDIASLAISSAAALLIPDPDFVEPLVTLRNLQLTGVTLSRSATLLLPQTLQSLSLNNVGLASIPADAFARLPKLSRFVVRDDLLREVDLSAAPALEVVQLTAPVDGLTLGPSIENVTLRNAHSAVLRGNCSSLRNVVIDNVITALPAGWLSACPAVDTLRVWRVRSGLMGADELRGARALRVLEVRHCGLRTLHPRWIEDAPALYRLDLSSNELEQLPSELVDAAPALEEVEMSSNRLGRAAVATLAALPALRALSLERNPLADLCGSGDAYVAHVMSPLWQTHSLRALRLARTGLARICRDWRSDLVALTDIDLRHNNISRLEFDDLQWRRTHTTTVDVRGNPVRDVSYTRDQFAAVLAGNVSDDFASSRLTSLLLDAPLKCDCSAYWFARAARERPEHARAALRDARCATGAALLAVPPHALLCALPAALGPCAAGCACLVSGERAELRCARAGLRRVPRAPRGLPARALLLPHNNISRLTPDDIAPELEVRAPSTVDRAAREIASADAPSESSHFRRFFRPQVLDLSDNRIVSIDPATTAVLFDGRRSVRLAGNPLRCDCDSLPLLRALAAHVRAAGAEGAEGAGEARCAGGEDALAAATRLAARCSPALWPLALVGLALAAASAVAAACLTRPVARQRFKRFLFERGLCLRWLLRPLREDDDSERPFDAFVSFSHLDAEFAAQLATRLERDAGLRLCLHERDWTPGRWIPAQIAESVSRSRRTLVLLSERFLASTWARAEMREAYAAALRDQRPRLLLLLLPGLRPELAAAADADLRAYLASVTYLRWDDPHFWDKLVLAMPRPRTRVSPAPAPSPAAAPAPSPAPAPAPSPAAAPAPSPAPAPAPSPAAAPAPSPAAVDPPAKTLAPPPSA